MPAIGHPLSLSISFSSFPVVRLAGYELGSAWVLILVLGEGWFGYHPNSRREMESPDRVWPWVQPSPRLALFQACFPCGLVMGDKRGRTPIHTSYFWLKLVWGGFLSFATKFWVEFSNSAVFNPLTWWHAVLMEEKPEGLHNLVPEYTRLGVQCEIWVSKRHREGNRRGPRLCDQEGSRGPGRASSSGWPHSFWQTPLHPHTRQSTPAVALPAPCRILPTAKTTCIPEMPKDSLGPKT